MAIAMAGTPLALSIGIPAGTFLGIYAGWRLTFGVLSVIALLLVAWIIAKVPDFASEPETQRLSLAQVFVVPGVRPVLAMTLCFVLAHNLLYTYIAPLLTGHRMADQIDSVLLVFGCSALVSIGLTGVLIDKSLRPLTFTGIGLFLAAAFMLAFTTGSPAIFGAALIWGLAFGGSGRSFGPHQPGRPVPRPMWRRRTVVGRYRPACRRCWIGILHEALIQQVGPVANVWRRST